MGLGVHGKDGAVSVGANAVASVTGFTYDTGVDVKETTAMQDAEKTFVAGLKDCSGTVDCWWQATDVGHNALLDALEAGETVELHLYPTGNSAGNIDYNGTVLITNAGMAQAKDDILTISFQYKGKLDKDTIV